MDQQKKRFSLQRGLERFFYILEIQTEEQLVSMQEISSSAQALASLADDLQKILNQFKI
ncbi:hypothetical protein D3C81_1393190 [compost metagenome]